MATTVAYKIVIFIKKLLVQVWHLLKNVGGATHFIYHHRQTIQPEVVSTFWN